MTHLVYLAILLGCLLATAPLEWLLHTGVYRRWRRLALAVLPVAAVFVTWDVWAVHQGQWSYDAQYVLAERVVGNLPIEELAFFLVIPTCAVLTLEAVRRRKPQWTIGDEPASDLP